MKQLRNDAALWTVLEGAVAWAKAERVLSFMNDETEKGLKSILSLIVTLVTPEGEIRQVAVGGLKHLVSKTSAMTAVSMFEMADAARALHEQCKAAYQDALSRRTCRGWSEGDWAAYDSSPSKFSADAVFGDSAMITLSRVETGSSDHCNGAKLAVKLVEEHVKSDGQQAALYGGGIWQAMVALGDDPRLVDERRPREPAEVCQGSPQARCDIGEPGTPRISYLSDTCCRGPECIDVASVTSVQLLTAYCCCVSWVARLRSLIG